MIHGLNNNFLYSAKKILVTIQIEDKTHSLIGTGFVLNKNGKAILVTNRHVAQPWYADQIYRGAKIISFEIESYQDRNEVGIPTDFKKARVINYNEFKFSDNPNDDVACLIEPKGDDIIALASIPYDFLADDEWISKKLSVCDYIAYPGFPRFFNKINNAPIFRMGTIASDPRLDYSGDDDNKSSSRIAYEGFSSGGASGSPVFAIQKGFQLGEGLSYNTNNFYREVKLIGINAGHYDDQKLYLINEEPKITLNVKEHSGISYFYKSSIIRKIIEG